MYNQFLHPPHIQVVNPVDLQENIVKLKPVVVQLAVVQENILDQHKFVLFPSKRSCNDSS